MSAIAGEATTLQTKEQKVPTLLIGLGGQGSSVVERIYGRLPEQERWRVASHVFDTDVGALNNLRHHKGTDMITQIGTDHLVGELRRYHKDVDAWMPYDAQLEQKAMLRGAGQIRAVSRLAFMHFLRETRADGLRTAMTKLQRMREDGGFKANPRVWIVASLAGGTGAGMFLQLALLVRQLLKAQHAAAGGFLVNGVFILPNLLIRTLPIPQTNHESMRANAQAAFRELEAINQSVNGLIPPLELEYLPDGRKAVIAEHPYDYAYLFDYQSRADMVLASYDEYLEQVARSMHMLLFSPMSDASESAADNNIRMQILKAGSARYAAAASASLTYPRSAIASYLSARWADERISAQWLAADDAYEVERQKFRERRKRHEAGQEPSRGDVVRRYVQERAEARDIATDFFADVYAQTLDGSGDNRGSKPRGTAWIQAAEAFIEGRVAKSHPGALALDVTELKTVQGVREAVAKVESQLMTMRARNATFVDEETSSVVAQIMTLDAEEGLLGQGSGRHRLNYWVYVLNKAIHPLAVRCVLYTALESLQKRLDRASRNVDQMRAEIEAYGQRDFDLAATADHVETLDERIDHVLRDGFMKRFRVQRELNDFADLYVSKSKNQFERLADFRKERLIEAVFGRLAEDLKTFINSWETFFDGLDVIRGRLQETTSRIERDYDRGNETSVRNVLVRSQHLNQLWERLQRRIGDTGEIEINNETYELLYLQFAKPKGRNARTGEGLVDAFQERLIASLRDGIDQLDLLPHGIVEAVRLEADIEGKEFVAHFKDHLEVVGRLAQPFLQLRESPRIVLADLSYWGLHTNERSKVPKEILDYFGFGHQAFDDAYVPNEIVRFTVPYLVQAQDVYSLTPGARVGHLKQPDGEYYTAFLEHAKAVHAGNITAHLDKRWDDALPGFWDDSLTVHRTLIVGMALGILYVDGGAWYTALRGEGGTFTTVELAPAKTLGHVRGLYDALEQFGQLTQLSQMVEDRLKETKEASLDKALQHHPFIVGMRPKRGSKASDPGTGRGVFNVIIESYHGNKAQDGGEREQMTQELFRSACMIVRNYVRDVTGDPNEAKRRVKSIVKDEYTRANEEQGKRAGAKIPARLMRALEAIASGIED